MSSAPFSDNIPYSTEIGIIGAGWVTSNLHLPVISNIDKLEVKYVSDLDKDLAKSAADKHSAKPLGMPDDLSALPKSDAVLLAVPVGVREQYFREFSSRSTPVFSEKPFAVTLEQHKSFTRAPASVACDYMRTNYNATRVAKSIVQTELLGRVQSASFSEGGIVGATELDSGHYQMDPSLSGGGVLMETGCHLLSQVVEIFDEYDLSVSEADIDWNGNIDVNVSASIDISNPNSDSVDCSFQVTLTEPVDNSATIEFERGSLSFDPRDPESEPSITVSEAANVDLKQFTIQTDKRWATTVPQALHMRWMQFLKQISVPDTRSEEYSYLTVTELIDQMYKSAGDNRGIV